MKKAYKSLLLFTGVGLMTVALASCDKNTRNSAIPYGANDEYKSATTQIATANGDLSLNMDQYYSLLRYSGYTTVTNAIRKTAYREEYDAIKEVIAHDTLDGVSTKTRELLTLSKDGKNLYDLADKDLDYTGELTNYEYIRKSIVNTINSQLCNTIFGTSSADVILGYEKEDAKKKDTEKKTIDNSYTKFIESCARIGITITRDELAYTLPDEGDKSDQVTFTGLKALVQNHEDYMKNLLTSQAETLSAKNALYQIADQEYYYTYDAEDDDPKVKNTSYYLFKDETLESSYESSYMTFGEYRIIVIQYSSRKEAFEALASTWDDNKSVAENYVNLYKKQYPYEDVTDENDEKFKYVVNREDNGLYDINDNVRPLVTETLEDGDYLEEPRNISNKYVMAYRISTTYSVDGGTEETKWDDLSKTDKEKYSKILKYEAVNTKAGNYIAENYKAKIYALENDEDTTNDFRIYDPLFEYKFYNSYSGVYELMDKKDFKKDVIFSYDGVDYTIADFFAESSKTYGTFIVTNQLQLEYAFKNCLDYLDEDELEDNIESLDADIKQFNKGNDSTYSKEIGLENFLLLKYGYSTREDVIKYVYKATPALNSYKTQYVFKNWATSEGKIDETQVSILNNILETGNAKYDTLFNINLDHVLINIDIDGDGSPDDPAEFLKDKDSTFVTKFEDEVKALAQAIYTEAASGKYGNNSYYKILSYIKENYEKDAELRSTEYAGKNWSDFKTSFKFLLTVEQLASSGDITQDSVSNFVTPFADYVKKVYETISKNESIDMDDYDNGLFYVYNKTSETGVALTDTTSASEITMDSLCATTFGYHLLVVNSYSGPSSTKYSTTDEDDYQKKLSILLYEDKDDEKNNITLTLDATNTVENAANLTQLFIYYVQKANGATSSLDSDITSILGTLFDSYITAFQSSSFQTYLLLKELNIQVSYDAVKPIVWGEGGVDVTYYANQITDYGYDEDYTPWITTYTWTRPEK